MDVKYDAGIFTNNLHNIGSDIVYNMGRDMYDYGTENTYDTDIHISSRRRRENPDGTE